MMALELRAERVCKREIQPRGLRYPSVTSAAQLGTRSPAVSLREEEKGLERGTAVRGEEEKVAAGWLWGKGVNGWLKGVGVA